MDNITDGSIIFSLDVSRESNVYYGRTNRMQALYCISYSFIVVKFISSEFVFWLNVKATTTRIISSCLSWTKGENDVLELQNCQPPYKRW